MRRRIHAVPSSDRISVSHGDKFRVLLFIKVDNIGRRIVTTTHSGRSTANGSMVPALNTDSALDFVFGGEKEHRQSKKETRNETRTSTSRAYQRHENMASVAQMFRASTGSSGDQHQAPSPLLPINSSRSATTTSTTVSIDHDDYSIDDFETAAQSAADGAASFSRGKMHNSGTTNFVFRERPDPGPKSHLGLRGKQHKPTRKDDPRRQSSHFLPTPALPPTPIEPGIGFKERDALRCDPLVYDSLKLFKKGISVSKRREEELQFMKKKKPPLVVTPSTKQPQHQVPLSMRRTEVDPLDQLIDEAILEGFEEENDEKRKTTSSPALTISASSNKGGGWEDALEYMVSVACATNDCKDAVTTSAAAGPQSFGIPEISYGIKALGSRSLWAASLLYSQGPMKLLPAEDSKLYQDFLEKHSSPTPPSTSAISNSSSSSSSGASSLEGGVEKCLVDNLKVCSSRMVAAALSHRKRKYARQVATPLKALLCSTSSAPSPPFSHNNTEVHMQALSTYCHLLGAEGSWQEGLELVNRHIPLEIKSRDKEQEDHSPKSVAKDASPPTKSGSSGNFLNTEILVGSQKVLFHVARACGKAGRWEECLNSFESWNSIGHRAAAQRKIGEPAPAGVKDRSGMVFTCALAMLANSSQVLRENEGEAGSSSTSPLSDVPKRVRAAVEMLNTYHSDFKNLTPGRQAVVWAALARIQGSSTTTPVVRTRIGNSNQPTTKVSLTAGGVGPTAVPTWKTAISCFLKSSQLERRLSSFAISSLLFHNIMQPASGGGNSFISPEFLSKGWNPLLKTLGGSFSQTYPHSTLRLPLKSFVRETLTAGGSSSSSSGNLVVADGYETFRSPETEPILVVVDTNVVLSLLFGRKGVSLEGFLESQGLKKDLATMKKEVVHLIVPFGVVKELVSLCHSSSSSKRGALSQSVKQKKALWAAFRRLLKDGSLPCPKMEISSSDIGTDKILDESCKEKKKKGKLQLKIDLMKRNSGFSWTALSAVHEGPSLGLLPLIPKDLFESLSDPDRCIAANVLHLKWLDYISEQQDEFEASRRRKGIPEEVIRKLNFNPRPFMYQRFARCYGTNSSLSYVDKGSKRRRSSHRLVSSIRTDDEDAPVPLLDLGGGAAASRSTQKVEATPTDSSSSSLLVGGSNTTSTTFSPSHISEESTEDHCSASDAALTQKPGRRVVFWTLDKKFKERAIRLGLCSAPQ